MADEATSDNNPPAQIPDDGFSDVTPDKAEEDNKTADQPRTNAENAARRVAEREAKQSQQQQPPAPEQPVNPEEVPDNIPENFLGKLQEDIDRELNTVQDEQQRRLQTIEARQYMTEARTATNQLLFEHQQAQQIPLFNPENPEFNKDAYEYFVNQYEAGYTVKDANGVIWPKGSFYQYMKGASELMGTIAQKGSLKGQQAEQKMRSRADIPSGKPARSTDDDDDFLKGFLKK